MFKREYTKCPCIKCLVFPACRNEQEYIHCSILWPYLSRFDITVDQKRYREEKIESLFKKRIHLYDARRDSSGEFELLLWWNTPEFY